MGPTTARLLALVLPAAAALAQPCTPRWTGDFNLLTGMGWALSMHDPDGAGPKAARMFVGGDLEWYGEPPYGRVRFGAGVWDGRTVKVSGLEHLDATDFAEHDADGPGPLPTRLFAAASDGRVWEGPDGWSPVGAKFDASVAALASWDPDGAGLLSPLLVACGNFTRLGNEDLLRVAAWDGSTWRQLGAGFDDRAASLLAFDDDGDGVDSLLVGGVLARSGGVKLGPIARWDGAEWKPVPGKFMGNGGYLPPPSVYTMAVFDEDGPGPLAARLFAAGSFHTIDGQVIDNIARFDGTHWLPLGPGITSGSIAVLRILDTDGAGPDPAALCAGGTFRMVGGLKAPGLAMWNGQDWSVPDWWPENPQSGDAGFTRVRDILAADPDGDGPVGWQVVVAGETPSFPTATRPLLAREADGFAAAGDGLTPPGGGQIIMWYGVRAMAPWDPDGPGGQPPTLRIGGGFPNFMAERAGGRTRPVPTALCCVVYDFQRVYAPTFMSFIRWDDDGDGPRPPAIYAGIYEELEGFPSQGILRLDPDGWSALGQATTPEIDAMAIFDPDGPGPAPEALIAGGRFDSIGGVWANDIARWDGAAWVNLGDGIASPNNGGGVKVMLVFDEDGDGPAVPVLFVGGRFTGAGGLPASHIARWNGQAWSDLAGGMNGDSLTAVYSLALFDEDGAGPGAPVVIAGGSFVEAGGSPALNLARWDGQAWTEVGGGVGQDQTDSVHEMTVFDDDGAGPRPEAVFVSGSFEAVGGQPADAMARWDGSEWEPIPDAPHGVLVMHPFDDDGDGPLPPALYVGGEFEYAGGVPALSLARWGCDAAPACPADCDADGSLDVLDWLCFLALFNAADPAADCDASGGLDLFDFLCFVNAFNAGC